MTVPVTTAAAWGSALLLALGVAFQLALAGGAPWGAATFGGRVPTVDGVLRGPFRLLAVVQGALLLGVAALVLVRAGVLTTAVLTTGTVATATWVVAGLLALNTLGNATAHHPLERWGMGTVTGLAAALTVVVAIGPTAG